MSRQAPNPTVRFRVATPNAPGAIAVIDLFGDIDTALRDLGARPVAVGDVALRDIGGIDEGVIIRWSADRAQVLPHAGPEVVRSIVERLQSIGAENSTDGEPRATFPEANDELEACMLEALSRAESPAAIDLLLAQPARWRSATARRTNRDEQREISRALNRTLAAPLVVAIGPPNVGKSTLTNALARESVSVVADQPGTTRDHVGVSLELPSPGGGIVIHWIDAPGVRPNHAADPIEREAIRLACAVAQQADLLLSCGDASSGFLDLDDLVRGFKGRILRIGLRADLGAAPEADLLTSATTGVGIEELAMLIRRELVPDAALAWTGPWIFHPSLTAASPIG